jgi:hypothetical protein
MSGKNEDFLKDVTQKTVAKTKSHKVILSANEV